MRIKHFNQTSFVNRQNEVKCSLMVEDWDGCNPYFLSASINETPVFVRQPNWSSEMEFFLPEVTEEKELTLELFPFEDTQLIQKFQYKPVKPWKIDFFLSSHEDLGYCAYANTLAEECADYLDAAIGLAEKDPEYAYMIEHYWWLYGYETNRSDAEQNRLKRLMQEGRIELSAPHCSNHTHWQGDEQLIRAMYYSCIEAKKKWGIVPETVVYADIAGASWSCVSAYAGAGIRYLLLLANRYLRYSVDDKKLPPIFWWQAPNGKDRLLCFRQEGYKKFSISHAMGAQSSQVKGGTYYFDKSRMEATVKAVEEMIREFGDVPYDRIPVSFYMDREYPNMDMKTVCDKMNQVWKYPELHISTPSRTMSYIERNFGDELPVLHGDITDQWSDFAAISPEWFSKKRFAQSNFQSAETLAFIETLEDRRKRWPGQRLDESMWKMCEFDDHCWATSSKHPQEMHRFNLYLVKKENADISEKIVRSILQESIGQPGKEIFGVWNTIPVVRKEMMRLPEELTPNELICQKMEDGNILTQKVEVPACGYVVVNRSCRSKAKRGIEIEGGLFETPFYQITCDRKRKIITSIWDKELKCELLDSNSNYTIGQCIYAHAEQKDKLPITLEFSRERGLSVYDGELAVEIVLEAYEEQIGANIRSVFTFYYEKKTIDIRLTFENATGLMGDYYDRYKKNLFFAFPFLVENHHFCTELAGGIVDERFDRLPVNPHDFVMAHNWVSVENDNYGIGLFSRDLPLFHLGGIHYNKLSSKVNYGESSSIFLYAASNRANNLNYCTPADCRGDFRISILPFVGKSINILPEWSYRQSHPLIPGGAKGLKKGESRSWFCIDQTNLRLLCIKPGAVEKEKVFIRLYEMEGKKTNAMITLPFQVKAAWYTNNVEQPNDESPKIYGNKLALRIDGFSYVNLLVEPEERYEYNEEYVENEVKNVFYFISENKNTVVCFEKSGKHYKEYAVLEGDTEIMRIKDEACRIQKCTLPGIAYQALRVVPV